jgi:hypothetical protein
MKKYTTQYKNYKINYHIKPGSNPSLTESLYKELCYVNKASGNDLKYGIFKENISKQEILDFFSKILLAVYYNEDNEVCGFFYNVIIAEDKPFVHQGLVMIFKNSGLDLLKIPYLYSNALMYEYFGKEYHISNISTVPNIIGIVSEIFEDVWPNYYSKNLQFPPKEYKDFCSLLYQEYIVPLFPSGITLNLKRFVLQSPLSEMGFGTNIRDLPRHHDVNQLLFVNFWIDLTKGEDLIQIGMMNQKSYENFKKILEKSSFNLIKGD